MLMSTNPKLVNRVEVVDEKGRSYVNWNDQNEVQIDFQDEGRTLKIFIKQKQQRWKKL